MKKKVLYALVIFISTTATAQYPTDSLQAYYPLDGNADDASMNGFDGVVNGPVPESGMCSMGYGFSDDHIDCGDPTGNEFDLVDDATLALWVKLRSAPATYYTLVGKDVGPGQSLEKWFFAMNTDSLSFHVNGPGLVGGLWCSSGTQSFGLDTFYHVAVTKQGDQYDFFVNGVHVGTDALPVNLPDVTAPLKMGRVDNPGVDHVLDEVFIYNRALSPAEPDLHHRHC